MRRAAVVAVFLAGCGRINFDEQLTCPTGYTASGGGCYRSFFSTVPAEGKSFFDAEAACEADRVGAHLAVPDDADEAAVIDAIVPIDNNDYWIGVTDRAQAGTYLGVNGKPAGYLVWASGEPDGGTDRCVNMDQMLLLADHDCAALDDYICEYDAIAAVPAAWGQ